MLYIVLVSATQQYESAISIYLCPLPLEPPSYSTSTPSHPCRLLQSTRLSSLGCTATSHSVQFSSVAQSCTTLCDPMDYSPPGSSVHGDSPGKNTGVDCHALLQGVFPTQGLNLRLLHYRQILYHGATRETLDINKLFYYSSFNIYSLLVVLLYRYA